jgi:glycosyltransferase involved in cell wall biosynthesis
VFPSRWYEGFPVTIAQAFACGLPVIASRLGAMRELVSDGKTGLHVNPGDPQDWAARIAWAWEHPEALEEMGRAARRSYQQSFTTEQSYARLLEIYRAARAARATRTD